MYVSDDNKIKYTKVTYCDTYGHNKESSKMILDVVVKDDQHRYYDFEIQNSYINEA